MAETKQCTGCRDVKSVSDFSRSARATDGRQFRCKACFSSYNRENAEARAARAAVYYAGRREEAAKVGKAWRQANKARQAATAARRYRAKRKQILTANRAWIEQNREIARAIHRKWAEANPDTVRANRARGRCQQAKATPKWADLTAIVAIYAEAARMSRAAGFPYEVDHIVPLRSKVVCGLHVEANLQILPAQVNRKKGNRWSPSEPLPPTVSPLIGRAFAT